MVLQVLNKEGKETGRSVTLSDAIFGIEPNEAAVFIDVKQYLANQRQGTHKSKQRAEVARTTKKLKKQKGTGGARAGSMKSPLFIGGGRVFGPQPRDYSFKVNKKTKQLARLSVLSDKARKGAILVVEDFDMAAPSTKQYIQVLNNLNVANSKTLLVTAEVNTNLVLSSRNLQKAAVATASSLNTYTLLNTDKLLLSETSVKKLEEILAQ